MSTTARLYIDLAPELGSEFKRYTVDCKFSTTRLWFSPGQVDLPEKHRVSVVLIRHEEGCGRCNLDRLWREQGDPALRDWTDQVWEQLQQQAAAEVMAGRRN